MCIQDKIISISHLVIKLGVACLVFVSVSAFSSGSKPNINPLELKTIFAQLVNDNSSLAGTLMLSSNVKMPVELEGTTKGNGILKIHNLFLRLYDQHDDGIIYEDDFLSLDIKDITNNGIGELIIYGIVKFTGDKETDPASYQSLVYIYTLDCSSGYFKVLYRNSDFSPELNAPVPVSVKCK